MLHMKLNCEYSASVSAMSPFVPNVPLVFLPELPESPHNTARKLLRVAITAAEGLLNPQLGGCRIRQEENCTSLRK